MKINIEASPKQVAELIDTLQHNGQSKEPNVVNVGPETKTQAEKLADEMGDKLCDNLSRFTR